MKTNKEAYLKLSSMLLLTLGIQLIQVLKSSRIAALFGTSVEMDAYNFLNSVAGFIFSIMGAGTGVVLVPSLVKKNSSMRACNGFLTMMYGFALLIIGILLAIRRPFLMAISGNTGVFIDIAASLMVYVLLTQLATSLNSVYTTVLNCGNSHVVPKILTLLVTFCVTVYVFIAQNLSIRQYTIISFVLVLGEMVVQCLLAERKGFHYSPCLPWKDHELRGLFRAFLPTVWGSGVFQLSLLVDSLIASTLDVGSISILGYANTISTMLNTSLTGNILTYIYPKIAADVNNEKGKRKLAEYMLLFATVMSFVVVLFIAAGHDAVRILFQRGKFTADATTGVFLCVTIYLVGAPINVMRDLVYRYFYSKGNTKSTFYNGLFASILNMVISIILAQFMGLYGIVLGTTITAVFSFVSILLRMRKQYTFGGNFPFFAGELLKLIGATAGAVLGCVVIRALPLGWPSLLISVIAAIAGILIFGIVLLLTRAKVFKVELG